MSSYADGEFLGEYVPSDYLRKKYLTVRPHVPGQAPAQVAAAALINVPAGVVAVTVARLHLRHLPALVPAHALAGSA
ncbi:unnamed protein product [Hymenolepis diminuta]|uniref:Ald_Xan_dh_C2 domain-containing protein n=1 Tax=Hymenolepis diminuta TaxID=6216 RepID=A0A0R3SIX1_HYMDI|nr:unnamed protein product [Hymenolepis diminuta]